MGHRPAGDSYHDRFYYTDEEIDLTPLKQAREEQARQETERKLQNPTLP